MNESQLRGWDRAHEVARADDHRARHRAQATRLIAARRRARLRALIGHLGRPRVGPRAPTAARHEP